MHIALCGPATLTLLQPYVKGDITSAGYPFPLIPALALQYGKLGHTVSVVTTASDIETVQSFRGEWLSLIIVPSRARARSRALDLFASERRGIRDALRATQPDVVHAHWTYEFAFGAFAARIAPVIVTAHDAPFRILRQMPDAYRLLRALMALLVRPKIRHLTAVSPYLAENWRKQMGYRRPISIITNPLPELDIRFELRSASPTILSIGNSSELKNIRTLIRAFAFIRATHPAAALRLVGAGLGPEGPMQGWANGEGIAQGVSFIGPLGRPEIARQYSESTIYCHPALEESQGMCLLEAMSARLPIIAGKDSGAVSWTLFDGAAGTLVDVRDPGAIAAAIGAILDNGEQETTRAARADAMAQERYSVSSVAAQYLKEYYDLAAGNLGHFRTVK